jgi:hypothetical protein
MELQELMERIQRWRLRQDGGAPAESEQRAYQEAPQPAYAESAEEAAPVESAEEQIAELDVEPDAVMSEEATSEMNLDQIEEVD